MIVFIDNEHKSGYSKESGERLMAARLWIKYRLEDLSGDTCLVIRYSHVSPELLKDIDAKAIFVSGSSVDPPNYGDEQAGIQAVFREQALPTFAFCGGFQVMAESLGAPLERIGALSPEESKNDPFPSFAAGYKKELGYEPISILENHPLLEGLSPDAIFRHAHSWEIKTVPEGFKHIASTDMTPIQMIVHESLPIVGTQFHPEYYTDEHPDGRILIENFMKWSGLI